MRLQQDLSMEKWVCRSLVRKLLEEIRYLILQKIHVESDDELSAMFPDVQAAIVHITKTDGSV